MIVQLVRELLIGYTDQQWGVAANYRYLQNNDLVLYSSMDVADTSGFTS